jgi:hypothetical protein
MEVIFSSIANWSNDIISKINVINGDAKLFFADKNYSESFKRIGFVFVSKNLTKIEQDAFKSKYIISDSVLIITLYTDNQTLLRMDIDAKVQYLLLILLESVQRNMRLKKIDLKIEKLLTDINMFFSR